MRISVIMAVYNGEVSIAEAIESILNQTYKDFEFIIIDDGSKDNSYDIIKKYAIKDNRIRLLHNLTNMGLTKTLNRAIKLSKSDFIARQDHDDISLPERLEIQLNFLDNNSQYAFCGSDIKIKQRGKSFIKNFTFNEIKRNLIVENCFAHPSILIRRSVFEKYGYYNEKYIYGQDYELWCRLIYKIRLKAINLNKKLIIFNKPSFNQILETNKRKFIIQMKNGMMSAITYLRYAENKFGGIKAIFLYIINSCYSIFYPERSKVIK